MVMDQMIIMEQIMPWDRPLIYLMPEEAEYKMPEYVESFGLSFIPLWMHTEKQMD